LQRL
jgi:hypothetical protein